MRESSLTTLHKSTSACSTVWKVLSLSATATRLAPREIGSICRGVDEGFFLGEAFLLSGCLEEAVLFWLELDEGFCFLVAKKTPMVRENGMTYYKPTREHELPWPC